MHDLKRMYEKCLSISREMFEHDVNESDNFRFTPRASKMSDLQVIALAVCSESSGIDSENWLFSKLKTDYRNDFPELIHRTRFNRRRRLLNELVMELTKRVAMSIDLESGICLVDSVPCPVVKNSREQSYSICKD